MTSEEIKKNESIQNRRYYVLMEDTPCWHWSRNKDDSLDWNIMGYNSEVVYPRKEISEDDIQMQKDDYAEKFLYWYRKNLTVEDNGLLRINSKQVLMRFKKELENL